MALVSHSVGPSTIGGEKGKKSAKMARHVLNCNKFILI
jgi:hypothetical protein